MGETCVPRIPCDSHVSHVLHVSYDSHAIVRMFRMPRKFCMTHIANRRLDVMRRADGDGND